MKKLVWICVIAVIVIGAYAYLFLPRYDDTNAYWETAWWKKSIYNFAKYAIPDGFEPATYLQGGMHHPDDKGLVLLRNKATGQVIAVTQLRGFKTIALDKISLGDESFSDSWAFEKMSLLPNFDLTTEQPPLRFLRQNDLTKIPDDLVIKGVRPKKQERPSGNTYYLRGSFEKIGLFKTMSFSWGFSAPAFDFKGPSEGAVVVMRDEKSGESLIIITAVPSTSAFDEEAFRKFLSTVSFNKDPFVPYAVK